MVKSDLEKILSGEVLDGRTEVTILQLCRSCAVQAVTVEAMVEQGVLEPSGKRGHHWCFPANSIRRTRIATRLQRDLGVNLAGAALALDLHSTWIQQSKAMNHSRWLNRLPVQTIEDDPELLMLKAWHLQNHGHYPEA